MVGGVKRSGRWSAERSKGGGEGGPAVNGAAAGQGRAGSSRREAAGVRIAVEERRRPVEDTRGKVARD